MSAPPPIEPRGYESIVNELLERLSATGVLTDVNPGSAVRTLVEAFAKELAVAHARLHHIYNMGFIDTATDASLDHLIAIMAEKRIDGLRALSEAVFVRDPNLVDRIVIPEGTELLIEKRSLKKQLQYVTLREAEMQAGQSAVTVPISTLIPEGEAAENYVLTKEDRGEAIQSSPLVGIASVTVAGRGSVRGHRESDAELRKRIKSLTGSKGGGTTRAMERAILSTGFVRSVAFRDATDEMGQHILPGEVEVVVEADLSEPGAYEAIVDAIHSSKGPGILAKIRGINTLTISIHLRIKPVSLQMSPEKRQALRRTIEQTTQASIERLKVGEKLLWNPLQAKVLSINGVLDIIDGTVIKIDGKELPPTRELPPTELSWLCRMVIPSKGPAVTVAFEGEETNYVRLITSASPDSDTKSSIMRAIAAFLDAKNRAVGERTLTYEEFVAIVKADRTDLFAGHHISVQIIDDLHGGESILTADGQRYNLGLDDIVYPHPDGPSWGVPS